ncbi:zinc finger BED domain-containing protein 1 isoform X14 [Nasonia vitripennis]|nr:zinc finger BED domain-containing protein 1 isoform X14 [Nasonia vitripennis]
MTAHGSATWLSSIVAFLIFINVSKFKSDVWKYFRRIDQSESECLVCNTIIKSTGNTTNLCAHLRRHHPKVNVKVLTGAMKRKASDETEVDEESPCKKLNLKESDEETKNSISRTPTTPTTPTVARPKRKKSQLRVDSIFEHQRSYTDDGAKTAEATKRLIFMLAKDKMLLSTVEKEGFKTFVSYTAPFYKIPNRNQITEKMEDKYKALSNNVKDMFSKLNDIVLTTDIWTDTVNNRSYLGLTSHFIDNGALRSIMIRVMELDDRHSANNIHK